MHLAQQEPSDKLIRTAAALERNESTCPYRDSSLGASAYNMNYPLGHLALSFCPITCGEINWDEK